MALRVLIVDDNAHFLEAARHLLDRGGVQVVGTASTSAEALADAARLRPDLVLVDVDLGDDSGFDLAHQLTEANGVDPVQVILISAYPAEDLGDLVEASAAVGFVAKSDLSGDAITALLGSERDR
ncbi:MAG: putative response regulator [Actinomycetia bacterium]|nr:putative response regulator [Actinomycetes bacterium]